MIKKKHVVLGVTGSIAAYKSVDIIRGLQKKGFKVSVVMTKASENFITPLTLSSLSGQNVYRSKGDEYFFSSMSHITLAQEADVLLISPATANIIGKMANGIADDLLTCIALATKAPVVMVPAMNTGMYNNSIVQENIEYLKTHRVSFIDPIKGELACGVIGDGHIADMEDIIKGVENLI